MTNRFNQYLITILIITGVTSSKFLLNEWTGVQSPLLLLFTGITLCAWLGGVRQGFFALLLSLGFITLVFLDLKDLKTSVWLFRICAFIFDSSVVIILCSKLHRSNSKLNNVYSSMEMTEKRLRKMFDSDMIGLIYCDLEGNIVDANNYFIDLLGIDKNKILRGEVHSEDITPVEYHSQSVEVLEEIKNNHQVKPFEKDYLKADGSRVTVLVGPVRIDPNSLVSFVLDITDRKNAENELNRLNNRLEESVALRTRQLTDMNNELTILVKESLAVEEQLRQSQNFLDSVFKNIPNMLFVKSAKDLKFVRFNKAGEELLGHTQEQLMGRNDYDFFTKEEADFFTSKDRQVLESRVVLDIPEESIQTKDGVRYLHTKKIPILDKDGHPKYLLGISEDITERKEAEIQRVALIHEQTARFEAEKSAARLIFLAKASAALSKSLEIPVMIDGFLDVVTEHFAERCSFKLKGITTDELYHTEKNSKGKVISVLSEDDALEEIQEVLITGRPFIAPEKLILPLMYSNEVSGCVTLEAPDGRVYDDLDISIANDLVRRVVSAIENAHLFLKAQEASRTKSAFLANISHEIRTPLGAMLGFAELALDEPNISKKQEAHIATILRNGQQLLRIVDEVLDLSKVESDRIEIEIIDVSLPKVISEVRMLLSVKTDEKGIELRVKQESDLPEVVRTDPVRLRQILINMVGNAIKFTEKGFVELALNYNKLDKVLEILVTDTGIGISEEQASKLFQPFVQADQSMTRKYGGTGLGLFLSRRLAGLMGGDVELKYSQPQQGSQFRILIPMEEVSFEKSQIKLSDPKRFGQEILSQGQTKVLIVDDAAENRILINAFLSKMGVNTDQASNGKEACEKALAKKYDVVLMDIQMPVMDGFEAVKKLRELGYERAIVALTAHAMKGDKEKCISSGFDDYLCKPLNQNSLAKCLMNFVENNTREFS